MLLAAGLVAGASLAASAHATTTRKAFTIYALATYAEYFNHADDRVRGATANPFNADTKSLAPLTKKKEAGKGPFPGDNALFSFKLYRDVRLRQRIGSAVYSCTFNFAHVALCEATFELGGGTMSATGPADFDDLRFTLAVNGGTGKYLGSRGQVSSAPASKDAHRLDFVLR